MKGLGLSILKNKTIFNLVDASPIITLNGPNPQIIIEGSSYSELGASTNDGSTVIIDSSSVDTNTVGTYIVTYNATDNEGNTAIEVTRRVEVQSATLIFDYTFDNTFN